MNHLFDASYATETVCRMRFAVIAMLILAFSILTLAFLCCMNDEFDARISVNVNTQHVVLRHLYVFDVTNYTLKTHSLVHQHCGII